MRSGKRFTTFVFLIVAIFFNIFSYSEESVKKYVMIIEKTEIKAMPDKRADTILYAEVGDRMEVLENLGKWIKVEIKNSIVGYVNSKYARIEIEKIVKRRGGNRESEDGKRKLSNKLNELKVKNDTKSGKNFKNKEKFSKLEKKYRLKRKNIKEGKKNNKRIEFKFNFSYGFINPSDLNTNINDFNSQFKINKKNLDKADIDNNLSIGVNETKNIVSGGFEFNYFFLKKFGISLELNIYRNNNDSMSELRVEDFYLTFAYNHDVQIYEPFIGINYLLSIKPFVIDFYGNAGYFIGDFYINMQLEGKRANGSTSFSEDWELKDLKKSTFGFSGGY